MGIYRRKGRDGEPHAPFIVRYPLSRHPKTGKILYTTVSAGYSRQEANAVFARKMLERQHKRQRGIEYRKELLFSELVDWYLALSSTGRLRTHPKIGQHCRILKAHFGNILAKDIKPFMIEDYQRERRSRKTLRGIEYRPVSVNREYEVLKRILNLAVREDFLDRILCFKVLRLPGEMPETGFFPQTNWVG